MMKKLALAAIAVVFGLGILQCGTCYAGDEGWAAAGGFLGGLVVGSAMNSRPTHHYYSYPAYSHSAYSYPVSSSYGNRRACYYPGYYSTQTTYYPTYGYDYGYDYWY